VNGTRWTCGEQPPKELRATDASYGGSVVLAQFSTRLPPDLIERLRVAAPQLALRQGDITAAALDRYLTDHGF
jgi:hypothetical protein